MTPNGIALPVEERRPRTTPLSLGMVLYVGIHLGALGVFVAPGSLETGLAILAATYLPRAFGLGAGYHRYFAHRAFRTGRVMQVILAVLGIAAMQKGPLWWAETHRRHHRTADTEEDLHSPKLHGFWYSHWGWPFDPQYRETQISNIEDFARFPELRWLDTPLASRLIIVTYVAALVLGFGWQGFVWGVCLSTVCTWHVVHWIQSMSHTYGGYRHFDTPDHSRNHWGLGIVSLGEFHNNHHHSPSSAQQGYKWWEVDVVYWTLRALGAVGIVWDVRDSLHRPTRLHAPRTRPETSRA